MKKPKRTTPKAASVPEGKLSEALLALTRPFFEPLGAYPSIHAIRNVLTLVVVAWNAYGMETPLWKKPGSIAGARDKLGDAQYPPAVAKIFEEILQRRAALHGNDLRLVGDWSVESNGKGGFSLNCDAHIANG